jgi:hypothetical protein
MTGHAAPQAPPPCTVGLPGRIPHVPGRSSILSTCKYINNFIQSRNLITRVDKINETISQWLTNMLAFPGFSK